MHAGPSSSWRSQFQALKYCWVKFDLLEKDGMVVAGSTGPVMVKFGAAFSRLVSRASEVGLLTWQHGKRQRERTGRERRKPQAARAKLLLCVWFTLKACSASAASRFSRMPRPPADHGTWQHVAQVKYGTRWD